MKKSLFIIVLALIHAYSIAQVTAFLEIDAKKELNGIRFLSAMDYSRFQYKNRSPEGINMYTLKESEFKMDSITLSEIFTGVWKGRVLSFLLPIHNETDYSKILLALSEAFQTQIDVGENKSFHGTNIIFTLLKRETSYYLFMAPKDMDKLPDLTDQNGIIDLLGKKITDPDVKQFISSIPGKNEKKEYENVLEVSWPGEGITVGFTGKGDDAVLGYIGVYFMKDNYYWKKTPFKGSIKLPYDITANTSAMQLWDMFGEEDTGPFSGGSTGKNYRRFKTYCVFGDPVNSNKHDQLNHITFK